MNEKQTSIMKISEKGTGSQDRFQEQWVFICKNIAGAFSAKKSVMKNRSSYILISAIILIISVILIADKLLSTGPVQFIVEGGKAVPVEGASYFSLNEVIFFIITAWFGGMSFLHIILYSMENETRKIKKENSELPENMSRASITIDLLEGDEKKIFQNIVNIDGILQRELIIKTGFSEPKVSRLLDRLEGKGLIVRQRDGMGNRIFLTR